MELVEQITCRRCSQQAVAHKTDRHLCEACVKAENNRYSHYRMLNYNWMEAAKEAELELWDRQPSETDREYQIWLTYRDAYPGIKPSYRLVAETLGTTVNAVRKVASRWDFAARLQAWARHCDQLTMRQREKEIVEMNARHISMAETLNKKIAEAIENLNPALLKPGELNALMKTATELENKARVGQQFVGNTAALPDGDIDERTKTKASDLEEVVKILNNAGVLSNFGIRKTTTTTTEVVVKEDE